MAMKLTGSQDDECDVDGGDASGVVRVDVGLIRGILVTSSHLGLLQTPPGAQPKAHIWTLEDLKICYIASTPPPWGHSSFVQEFQTF